MLRLRGLNIIESLKQGNDEYGVSCDRKGSITMLCSERGIMSAYLCS